MGLEGKEVDHGIGNKSRKLFFKTNLSHAVEILDVLRDEEAFIVKSLMKKHRSPALNPSHGREKAALKIRISALAGLSVHVCRCYKPRQEIVQAKKNCSGANSDSELICNWTGLSRKIHNQISFRVSPQVKQ